MATTTAGPAPTTSSPGFGAGRVAAVVGGSFAALVALGLLLAGVVLVWAHATQRDADGFFTSEQRRLSTPTAALTAEGLRLGDLNGGGEWVVDAISADVRVRAARADGEPVFVGIARERDLDAYLSGVAHDEVREVHDDRVALRRADGAGPAGPPAAEDIWVARASGSGTQTVEWEAAEGEWAAVVMNADGRPGVTADVAVGARTDVLLPVGIGLLIGGVLLLALSGALLVVGTRGAGRGGAGSGGGVAAAPAAGVAPGLGAHPEAAVTDVAESARPYPVAVEARLDEPLSRLLWLVKWILAIPHFVVLAFLWAAFAVLTIVAWFAVVVTGRYPRGIFDFNAGVLRWSWRVGFYATSAIGTDRYPPFTLAAAPDYPAQLDVPYPDRLSRGRALVKTWLLALPHYAILAGLYGAWNATWTWGDAQLQPPGVITVLVVVAGAVLLVTGRYPREVFRLLVGINRWLYRVIAYAALMRDEYPPFRLER
jgi:hypothetical protein